MTEKTYKAIMVGYASNHKRDMYNLYNPETKRVIMTRDVYWAEFKITGSAETLKVFRDMHEEYLVPDIEEDNITTSDPEENLPVYIIPDEGESVRLNKNSKSSEFTYHNKDANTDTSAYDRLFNSLKKPDN